MSFCTWCSAEFEPNVSYQIYCSPECRASATKEKINQRYQTKRRQKRLKERRRCSGGCGTVLSMYNDAGFCSACNINTKQVDKTLKELRGLIEYEKFEE